MRFLFSFLVILACFSQNSSIFAQCSNGSCANGNGMAGPLVPVKPRGGFNPPPRQDATAQNYPQPQVYPQQQQPTVINGKNGVDGKNGKDGKDADPAVLDNLTKAVNALNNQLQQNQANMNQMSARLASLEKSVNGISANNIATTKIQSEVDSLNQKLAGSLRVRFKYDPKTSSLTPIN